MTLTRPCVDCGELSEGTRCAEHTAPDPKPTATQRGYDSRWKALSKRARRLQPFCTDCGSTADLQTDHSPQAWERHARGLAIRVQDVDVVCGPCNRARGAARGKPLTRGNAPLRRSGHPGGRPSLCYTPAEATG